MILFYSLLSLVIVTAVAIGVIFHVKKRRALNPHILASKFASYQSILPIEQAMRRLYKTFPQCNNRGACGKATPLREMKA